MVTIRPVRRQDVRLLIGLEVAPKDAAFVAPDAVTLAQAPYEIGAHVLAICYLRWAKLVAGCPCQYALADVAPNGSLPNWRRCWSTSWLGETRRLGRWRRR